jgi:uncharacterized protein (TIGR04255 family)
MKTKMPKKLKKEPIIDAVFELRFTSLVPASSVLPGILFSKLTGEKKIDPLPASQLPEQIRNSDPNLQFAPLTRITCGQFIYSFGDRSMAVACKNPYPGWTAFKSAILEASEYIETAGVISSVQRIGLKYVDMISADCSTDKTSLVELDLTIGKHKLGKETFQVRVEIPNGNLVNVVQIVSEAKVTFPDGTMKEGLIIDVDTITTIDNLTMLKLLDTLRADLDNIHDANVELFFDCLKPETIVVLEPVYE